MFRLSNFRNTLHYTTIQSQIVRKYSISILKALGEHDHPSFWVSPPPLQTFVWLNICLKLNVFWYTCQSRQQIETRTRVHFFDFPIPRFLGYQTSLTTVKRCIYHDEEETVKNKNILPALNAFKVYLQNNSICWNIVERRAPSEQGWRKHTDRLPKLTTSYDEDMEESVSRHVVDIAEEAIPCVHIGAKY